MCIDRNGDGRAGTSSSAARTGAGGGNDKGNGGAVALYAQHGWLYGGRGQSECAVGAYDMAHGTPPLPAGTTSKVLTGLWHWEESGIGSTGSNTGGI